MDKTQVNPWTWQDQFGFSQAWKVDDVGSVVFLSGQGPVDENGQVVGAGDFEAQARQVFENLRTVLEAAGATFESVVKVTAFLTDMSELMTYGRVKNEFMSGPQPASSAIGVAALALPGMMLEVEAIAVL